MKQGLFEAALLKQKNEGEAGRGLSQAENDNANKRCTDNAIGESELQCW